MIYFIRVNGASSHTDPAKKECFVEIEPQEFHRPGYSNYLDYCLKHNFVRIGWPDVGDLRTKDRRGAKSNCYNWNSEIVPQGYLIGFFSIKVGSIILVPNRDKPGDVYIGEVNKPYWYETNGPYECSHRIGVAWDRNTHGEPRMYPKESLGITHYGGFWLRAFAVIEEPTIIKAVNKTRQQRNR